MILADTDVLIDLLAGKPAAAAERVSREMRRGNLATTVVRRFEFFSGGKPGRQMERIQRLLDGLPTLPLDTGAADRAAEIRHSLEARGLPIGTADTLIAGIALHHSASLLTGNRKHFSRVEGLRLAT